MFKENDPKMIAFAQLLETHQLQGLRQAGLDCETNIRNCKVVIKAGKKYHKVDVGGSGKYMVEAATGKIYGIKAYGVVHLGHQFGTLDTIDSFNWGGYRASRATNSTQNPTPTEQTPPADPSAFLAKPKEPDPVPVVGMGVTQTFISDREPFTVVEIIDPHTIVVQADIAKRTDKNGQSESQEYTYEPDPNGEKVTLTWRENGTWHTKGNSRKEGCGWWVGERRKYWDPGY